MIGPWPPDRKVDTPLQPLTDAERIKQLEQTVENLKTYIPKPSEPCAVFSSKLGRLLNLKQSRW